MFYNLINVLHVMNKISIKMGMMKIKESEKNRIHISLSKGFRVLLQKFLKIALSVFKINLSYQKNL